jgi:hypothetical protein
MTHPILKEPQTLVESIIQRYATRPTNEFDPAGATYRRLLGSNGSANGRLNLQIIAQRRIELDLYLTPADVVVRLLRPVERARPAMASSLERAYTVADGSRS